MNSFIKLHFQKSNFLCMSLQMYENHISKLNITEKQNQMNHGLTIKRDNFSISRSGEL